MVTLLPLRHTSVQVAIDEAYREGYEKAKEDYTFRYVLTGPLIIDTHEGLTYVQAHLEAPLSLTSTETRVMRLLAEHVGMPVGEYLVCRVVWETDEAAIWGKRSTRLSYISCITARINAKIRQAGVSDRMIVSGYARRGGDSTKTLLKLPPEGEGGEQENIVGYSRAEVRKIMENGLVHLRAGRQEEAEALFQAAVNGLPDAITSAEMAVGRPNMDQRVIDALTELGAGHQYVRLKDIARHLRVTPAFAAKAILRARGRRSDILHLSRFGYYFAGIDAKAAKKTYLNAPRSETPVRSKEAT